MKSLSHRLKRKSNFIRVFDNVTWSVFTAILKTINLYTYCWSSAAARYADEFLLLITSLIN